MSSGFTSERCWIWGRKHSYTHTYTMTRWVECSHYFNSIAEAPIEYIQKGPRDMLYTMQIAFFSFCCGGWTECEGGVEDGAILLCGGKRHSVEFWKNTHNYMYIFNLFEKSTWPLEQYVHKRTLTHASGVLWRDFMFSADVFINICQYLYIYIASSDKTTLQ